MSKGDRDRTVDREAYRRGWERVFGGREEGVDLAASPDVRVRYYYHGSRTGMTATRVNGGSEPERRDGGC